MLQTNSWTCRQSLSAAVLQTNFVCTRSPDRQTLQTNFVCRKSAKTWPKCRQILQTNFVCKKLRRKLGQNVDKSCRQTLSRPTCSLSQSLSANFVMQRFVCRVYKVCLQRYNLCHAEVVQRLHRGCAEAVQGLCRGCIVAAQWLHSGCAEAVQRLCRGSE